MNHFPILQPFLQSLNSDDIDLRKHLLKEFMKIHENILNKTENYWIGNLNSIGVKEWNP